MATLSLLEAIRGRAAARGLTLADLARASEMHPGNLRRMLTRSGAAPRLSTVMRLLPPLDAAIAPAGARSAEALGTFFEDERARRGVTWEELLAGQELRGPAIARRLQADPGLLSLDVVMRLADALGVELSIVDAGGSETSSSGVSRRRGERAAPSKAASSRGRSSAPPRERAAERPRAATSPHVTPASESPASSPAGASELLGPPPLRPPRLGRYRDAPRDRAPPPPSPPACASAPAAASATRAQEHFLVGLAQHLHGFARVDPVVMARASWLVAGWIWPEREFSFLEKLQLTRIGYLLASGARDVVVEAAIRARSQHVDAAALVDEWRRSSEPGYVSPRTRDERDAWGRDFVVHGAVDGAFAYAIEIGGSPVEIAARYAGEVETPMHVPLILRFGALGYAMMHARAGPVFGSLVKEQRRLLVAGIAADVAVVEVGDRDPRVLWCGPPEALPHVDLNAHPPEVAAAPIDAWDLIMSAHEARNQCLDARWELLSLRSRLEEAERTRDQIQRAATELLDSMAARASALEAALEEERERSAALEEELQAVQDAEDA